MRRNCWVWVMFSIGTFIICCTRGGDPSTNRRSVLTCQRCSGFPGQSQNDSLLQWRRWFLQSSCLDRLCGKTAFSPPGLSKLREISPWFSRDRRGLDLGLLIFGSPTKSNQLLGQTTSSPSPVPSSLISLHQAHGWVFPPTAPAGPPQPGAQCLGHVCFHTDSVLCPAHLRPQQPWAGSLGKLLTAEAEATWNLTGFWYAAKPVSEVRFIDRVTTCKQHKLPLLQTFCRKDALCR